MPKALKHGKHPSSVLYFTRIGLDITVVKSGTSVHVDFVIIPEMGHKERDVSNDTTLRASVRTTVRSEVTERLVLEFAVVRKNLGASEVVKLARQLKGLGNFLES